MGDEELIEALNEIDERKAKMPERCPNWCDAEHIQAVEEGCSVANSRKHMTGDLVGQATVQDERTLWNLWLYADPGEQTSFTGEKYLEIETHRWAEVGNGERFLWRMHSGDARVLARQLLHFADLADLDD